MVDVEKFRQADNDIIQEVRTSITDQDLRTTKP
jgi:hypothetical protein